MPTAEQIQKLFAPLFPGLMGVEIVEATQEKVVASMLVRPDLCTAGNVCHGGAFIAIDDTIDAGGAVMHLAPRTPTTTTKAKNTFPAGVPAKTRVAEEDTALPRCAVSQV